MEFGSISKKVIYLFYLRRSLAKSRQDVENQKYKE